MASAPRGAPGLLSKSLGEPARSGASSAATAGTSSAPVQANKQNQAADDGSPWHAAQPPVAPAGVSTSAFYGSSPVHGRGISHLVRPAAWDPGHGLRSHTDTEVCRLPQPPGWMHLQRELQQLKLQQLTLQQLRYPLPPLQHWHTDLVRPSHLIVTGCDDRWACSLMGARCPSLCPCPGRHWF